MKAQLFWIKNKNVIAQSSKKLAHVPLTYITTLRQYMFYEHSQKERKLSREMTENNYLQIVLGEWTIYINIFYQWEKIVLVIKSPTA